MAGSTKALLELFEALWALKDLKDQGLITNPQSDQIEAKIKAEIDAEIAG